MPVSVGQKTTYLDKAIEIAKLAAGSGGQNCTNDAQLAKIIKATYDQIVHIAESIKP